jgi:hypothetical protein
MTSASASRSAPSGSRRCGGDWHDAIEMDNAQVALTGYCPDWWPADTRLLIRRVKLEPVQVSADPRSRRRRTLPRTSVPCRSLSWPAPGRSTPAASSWLHQLTARTADENIPDVHGVRGGKAMTATLRWRLIAVPGRLIRHARHLVLRLPPGHGLLPEVLTRLRELPAPA